MRLRFFVTIFIVLCITAASVSAIHYHFFKLERLRLMELNLEQNASLLSESDLSLSKKEFSNLGQEFIDELIGDDKVNMIVAIYSSQGNILYRNDNAYIFEMPEKISTRFSTWEDVEHKDYFIKFLTKRDPKNNRIIRVGMLLNQTLIRWKGLNQRIYVFVGIILLVNTFISFFLTYLLFRPVKELADTVNRMAEKIEEGKFNENETWFPFTSRTKRNDEFSYLISSLEKLSRKLHSTQQITQRWSALMAHELKTPMTLLRMSIEEMMTETKASNDSVKAVETELKKLEDIIMDFLDWASEENSSTKPEIHAINVPLKAQEFVRYFEKTVPSARLELINRTQTNPRVFCNPIHFDQLLNNIISNSVKYGGGEIKIICEDSKMTFADNGPGLPEKVLHNFGKPFNKFAQKGVSGQGLGLAWVNTIANKYDWKIDIDISLGTRIQITFPQN